MKTILTVLLAMISTSVFGQGVSVRSNNGRATNLTAYGNVTLGGNLINTWDDVTNYFTQTGSGGGGVTNNQYLPGVPVANGSSFTNLNAANLATGTVPAERAGSISNHTDVSAGAFVSGGYFGWDAVTGTFTNGLPAVGAGGGGSATNLTPWTSAIDGGGFSLSNASLTGPLLIWNTNDKTNGSYSDATGQIHSNAVGSVKLSGSKVYMGTNLNGTINTTNVLQVDTQAGNALNVDTNRGVTMKGGLALGTSIAGAVGTLTTSGLLSVGAGITAGSSIIAGANLQASLANDIRWSSSSRESAPVDGTINFSDSAGLAFTNFTFGPGITIGARQSTSTNYPGFNFQGTNASWLGNPLLTIRGGTNSAKATDVVITGALGATNGLATYATTTEISIPANGLTNTMGINATAYVSAVAVSFTINNRANTVIYTSPTLTATLPVHLQPGWSVQAASGLTGTLLPN